MSQAKGIRLSRRASRAGFSLAETLMAIGLAGGLLVVSLNVTADAMIAQQWLGDRNQGRLLAQGLMAEILSQDYEEPGLTGGERLFDFTVSSTMATSPTFGRDSSESGGGRVEYDDVDDYDLWTASPPERKDGTVIPNLARWGREVSVVWMTSDMSSRQVSADATGIKSITVTVTLDNAPVTELTATKTVGLPTPGDIPTVLLVVTDPISLTVGEAARQALMLSAGFVVHLIAASDTQANFDTEAANADVAYVSEQVNELDLGTKLKDVTIGVVNEDIELVDDFALSSGLKVLRIRDQIDVNNNTHYITSTLTTGTVTILSQVQPVHMLDQSDLAPGLQVLAQTADGLPALRPSLAVADAGAQLYDATTAAGRRVHLPWGDAGFEFDSLNATGKTLAKRAIEWAASMEQGTGP